MSERRDPPRTYLSDPEAANGPGAERVQFVSRSSPEELATRKESALPGPSLPRVREWRTLLLFLLAFALQLYSWDRLEGYQIADSVEYMERAHAFATGEELDPTGAVRSFGFSTILVPFFYAANQLGLDTLLPVVHAVRLLQMALGLGLVFVCMRIAARVGGRRVGYAAGFLCAINPIFLQYTVSPVSGVAAAFFIALALDCLIERGGFRRSLAGGLALGIAFLMAYQTILITGPLLVLVLLRDRCRRFRGCAGVALGLALGVGLQVLLDKVSYGVWGVSIRNYLIENVGGVTTSLLFKLGLQDTQFAKDIYEAYIDHLGVTIQADVERGSGLQSLTWYLSELHTLLVWPVLALFLIGLIKSWTRASWKSSLLLVLLVVNASVMALKGSKSFRLWLPLLPMIVPLCAWGWGSLRGTDRESPGAWRAGLSALVLLGGLWLGLGALREINTRKYGPYWEAMEFVNGAVSEDRTRVESLGIEWQPPRVSAVYNWAVFARQSADVSLVKFNDHVHEWIYLDEEQRKRAIDEVGATRWLILHRPVLDIDPELTRAINGNFEVAASFWNEDAEPGLGEVLVFRDARRNQPRKRSWEGVRQRRLWEVLENVDPDAYRDENQLDANLLRPLTFLGRGENGRQQKLHLLGFEFESLPGTGFGWITYHWWTDTGFDHDYEVIDRLLIRGDSHAWHNNHAPGHGLLPTTVWKPGWAVREGYVVIPGSNAFKEDEEFRPLGGPWRRGDSLPATLWIKTAGFDEAGKKIEGLRPADRGTGEKLTFDYELPPSPWLRSPEGYRASRDWLILVGQFSIPVHPRYRWPDDGTPDPE